MDDVTLNELIGKDINEVDYLGMCRVVKPNQCMTCDYRLDRLTIIVDDNNLITQAYYG